MKRIVALSLLLLLLCCSAYAHSGRTDSKGGHWNHSTGEYHYHHGYSAHQHPNGVCPYESKATAQPTTRPPSGTYTYEEWRAAMAGKTVEPTPTPKPTKTPRPTRTPKATAQSSSKSHNRLFGNNFIKAETLFGKCIAIAILCVLFACVFFGLATLIYVVIYGIVRTMLAHKRIAVTIFLIAFFSLLAYLMIKLSN